MTEIGLCERMSLCGGIENIIKKVRLCVILSVLLGWHRRSVWQQRDVSPWQGSHYTGAERESWGGKHTLVANYQSVCRVPLLQRDPTHRLIIQKGRAGAVNTRQWLIEGPDTQTNYTERERLTVQKDTLHREGEKYYTERNITHISGIRERSDGVV